MGTYETSKKIDYLYLDSEDIDMTLRFKGINENKRIISFQLMIDRVPYGQDKSLRVFLMNEIYDYLLFRFGETITEIDYLIRIYKYDGNGKNRVLFRFHTIYEGND